MQMQQPLQAMNSVVGRMLTWNVNENALESLPQVIV